MSAGIFGTRTEGASSCQGEKLNQLNQGEKLNSRKNNFSATL